MYSNCCQPVSYSVILPSGPLMMPRFTGKSMNWISWFGVEALTKSRSGMNDPNGTFTNRLLSTSHAEYRGSPAASSASLWSCLVLSKPWGSVCGGRPSSRCWSSAASELPPLKNPPAAAAMPSTPTRLVNFRNIVDFSPGKNFGTSDTPLVSSFVRPAATAALIPTGLDHCVCQVISRYGRILRVAAIQGRRANELSECGIPPAAQTLDIPAASHHHDGPGPSSVLFQFDNNMAAGLRAAIRFHRPVRGPEIGVSGINSAEIRLARTGRQSL